MLRQLPGAAGWMCSSPNSRPNAFCCSGVMCWSRKKITPLSISASWISLNVGSSRGWERSTPRISAPACGVSFSTWIEA